MKKNLIVLLTIIICLIAGFWYLYINRQVTNPFQIDFSKTTSTKFASTLLDSKQMYSFHLLNTSDKSIKLIEMQLDGYEGIKIGSITMNGKVVNNLQIASKLIDNKGIVFDYEVIIQKPNIINPQRLIIIYEYLGIKHKQTVQIPGLQP